MSKEVVKVGIGLHNRFDFEIRNLPTWYRMFPRSIWPSIRKFVDVVCSFLDIRPKWLWGTLGEPAMAENVVLNQAWQLLFPAFGGTSKGSNGGSVVNGCLLWKGASSCGGLGGSIALGSGSTAPAVTQTDMATPVYVTPATILVSTTVAADNLSGNVVQSVVIDAGVRTGDVYREVGLKAVSALAIVTTRALIVDSNSQPMTITKADLQVVTITATVYGQISHAYGPNFLPVGVSPVGINGTTQYDMNAIAAILFGNANLTNQGGVGFPAYVSTNVIAFQFGSDGTAPTLGDMATIPSNQGVRTLLTGGNITATVVTDTVNKKLTYSCRVPSTVAGTIREISLVGGVMGLAYPNSCPFFRFTLPAGNNSPTYDNVYNQSSIVKNNTNVVDISIVFQFGSL